MRSFQKCLLLFLFLVVACVVLSGCGSTVMMNSSRISSPETGYALVTFLRPSAIGGAIKFSIWDSEKFVGVLTRKSYIQYQAQPGEHVFIARAENWSFVKANLEPGKKYYIIGRVVPGVWKARVALDPIGKGDAKISDEQIDKWLQKLDPIAPDPAKADSFVRPRLSQIQIALNDYKEKKVSYFTLEKEDYR